MKRSPVATWIGRLASAGAGAGLVFPGTALAHHAMGGAPPSTTLEGILSGLAHPVLGPDHLLFLLVAGLLVAPLPAAARLAAAALLVIGQMLGTALHLAAVGLQGVDALIALTVIAGGLILAARPLGAAALAGLLRPRESSMATPTPSRSSASRPARSVRIWSAWRWPSSPAFSGWLEHGERSRIDRQRSESRLPTALLPARW
jgi:hypothetical protein